MTAVTSVAADAVEDAVYKARRAVNTTRRRIDELKDESVYRVRRAPFKAIGMAAGAGVVFGIVVGWFAGRVTSTRCPDR
jgi:ElaB/YqjD/DUF883 family membrane-anchored ribosome-binding protein